MKTSFFLPGVMLAAVALLGCDPRVDKQTLQKLDGTWEVSSVTIRERIAADGTALPDTVVVNPSGEIVIDFCDQANDCPITETLSRSVPVPHVFSPPVGKNPEELSINMDPFTTILGTEGISGTYRFRFDGDDAVRFERTSKTTVGYGTRFRGQAIDLNLVRKE